ncbi:MAG TPA: hybrid sensor histidine kinase/response regulator [Pyrinomonadaceae bacterium]|nr:hybrid sensor histidine kinase/response regulator [Pyrinomonadaceae bacterium]
MSTNMPLPTHQPQIASSLGFTFSSDEDRERILIVDDSSTVRKIFTKCLSIRYSCAEAFSVNDAFAKLAETEFALVITDVLMPGLSGVELLRKIIEAYPDTAVIMVSGVNQPQRALDAVRLGAFDYLFKPCDLGVLELTVERALERRSLLLNARQHKRDLEMRNNELVRGKAQLQRLQAQIVHSEKMASLGQLAAGIAHELNNPVGFVYGNLDILNQCVGDLIKLLNYYDKANLPGDIASGAALIRKEIDYEATLEDLSSIICDCRDGAERIRDIVQNLRTFSRLDEAELKKTDIHEGIDSTVRLLSRYFSADNITLVRDYGKLPPVDAFSGQLNQVWMNLLVNAAQAVSAGGGRIRITTRADEESVIVSITDTGGGIAPEHLNRIFDPFYTTKPVGEGTGLGLSISFGIVERHGGKITVNTVVGEGTTFTVALPIRIKTPSPAAAEF